MRAGIVPQTAKDTIGAGKPEGTSSGTVCQSSSNPINYFTVAGSLWECLYLLPDIPLFHFYDV